MYIGKPIRVFVIIVVIEVLLHKFLAVRRIQKHPAGKVSSAVIALVQRTDIQIYVVSYLRIGREVPVNGSDAEFFCSTCTELVSFIVCKDMSDCRIIPI